MPIIPVNRSDGRHWCRPASASPEESPAVCPDCGQIWIYDNTTDFPAWSRAETMTTDVPILGLFDDHPGD